MSNNNSFNPYEERYTPELAQQIASHVQRGFCMAARKAMRCDDIKRAEATLDVAKHFNHQYLKRSGDEIIYL